MGFIKRGDAQPITSIITTSDEELEKMRKKAEDKQKEATKNSNLTGNKIESSTESKDN